MFSIKSSKSSSIIPRSCSRNRMIFYLLPEISLLGLTYKTRCRRRRRSEKKPFRAERVQTIIGLSHDEKKRNSCKNTCSHSRCVTREDDIFRDDRTQLVFTKMGFHGSIILSLFLTTGYLSQQKMWIIF